MILYEYDLNLHRFLNRQQAKNKVLFRRELEELNEEPIKITLDKTNINNIFLTGDLHLNHTNIITYCNRPFSSVKEMNRVLVDNWNKTVGKEDMIFYLGDLAFGRNKNKIQYWLKKLNGRVFLIRGNHDKGNLKSVLYFDRCIITYKRKKFLLIHNPRQVEHWDEWIIHGHHHNNHLENYPFINCKNKTINVSTELTGFKPISLGDLIDQIEKYNN
jgi:calcineurin-like phosphoesterase family protein